MKAKKLTIRLEASPDELAKRNEAAKALAQGGFPQSIIDPYLWRLGLDAATKMIQAAEAAKAKAKAAE